MARTSEVMPAESFRAMAMYTRARMALASVADQQIGAGGNPGQLAGERMGKVRGAATYQEEPVGVDDGLVKASAEGKLIGERGAQGKHRLHAAEERTQRHEQHKDQQQ